MKYAMNPQDSGPVTATDELWAQADLQGKSSAARRSQKITPMPVQTTTNSLGAWPVTASA